MTRVSLTQDLTLNGASVIAEPSGALYWPARETLIVADLHLEKGSSFARRGQLLPPYDSRTTLSRLADALRARQPKRLICLGDSFHDADAAERLGAEERETIRRLAAAVGSWIWIAGNHDPAPPADLGGAVVTDHLIDGPLVFRHEALAGPAAGEISGHFHPKAAVTQRGRRIAARCFVEDGRRAILPSFGAYTGGLNVLDPAISRHYADGFRVHLLGPRKVYSFPRSRLLRAG
ncbi:MAG: ligase-associated DNA damage response endonuclease PdeM [Marivibrio sp.]|uniref:ligase-associated DNA damage response endonuclease PdeM n=1 Tax=Marivibrio sp. TaxID=2039719 RepID=UPI0032EFFF40